LQVVGELDIMVVGEVLVDFFGMDHQHQQKPQMDRRSHIQIALLTQYLLVVVRLLLDHILLVQNKVLVELPLW
jgi:hypothetical protein